MPTVLYSSRLSALYLRNADTTIPGCLQLEFKVAYCVINQGDTATTLSLVKYTIDLPQQETITDCEVDCDPGLQAPATVVVAV